MGAQIQTNQPILKNPAKILRKIAHFWNKTSQGWKHIWGIHIHHGYYEEESFTPLQAQEKLIEKLAKLIEIKPQTAILDVGCGMGGTSVYLAKNYNVRISGITLSTTQLKIARELANKNNVSHINFTIEDAHSLESFQNNTFDVVWSLESCEQFHDKKLFIQQAYRVLKPGGQLLLATWCSDKEIYENKSAKKYKKLCKVFDLPYMPTMNYYKSLLESQGFLLEYVEDWSKHVEKSWSIGLNLMHRYHYLEMLRMSGLRGIRFALQVKRMQEAFETHKVRYGVFLGKKL